MSARSIGCKTCAKPLYAGNTSGYCKAHYIAAANRDPAIKSAWMAKRAKTVNRPEHRAWMVQHLRTISRLQLAWCPLEYQDDYRVMRKKIGARDARQIIERQAAADARCYARTGILPQSNRVAQ